MIYNLKDYERIDEMSRDEQQRFWINELESEQKFFGKLEKLLECGTTYKACIENIGAVFVNICDETNDFKAGVDFCPKNFDFDTETSLVAHVDTQGKFTGAYLHGFNVAEYRLNEEAAVNVSHFITDCRTWRAQIRSKIMEA